MRIVLLAAALLVVAAAPAALAQGWDTSCEGGPGALFGSCAFPCYAGQSLSAWANGLAYATARCGGGQVCSLPLCSERPYVSFDDWGTCDVTGYFWVSYGCSAW